MIALTIVVSLVYVKVSNSDLLRQGQRIIGGSLDGIEVTPVVPVGSGVINPELKALPKGTWFKIHQHSGRAGEDFERQAHGGAAFDPVRGRLMLFGSDTHRRNWDNTIRFFDMGSLRWSSAYPPDSFDTYRVNTQGIPVAGIAGDRPWAMHTFGAVEFDPIADRLIVASHPDHMNPNKKWGVDRSLWGQIKSHPTWIYHVGEGRWEPMPLQGRSFFAHATAFDLKRRAVIGARPNGYWELAAEAPAWKHLAKGTPNNWHISLAYDSGQDTVVLFGTNKKSDAVWQYRRGAKAGMRMQTPGNRPAGDQSVPLVYHPGIQRVTALVERNEGGAPAVTETWLYATADDTWKRLETASLPFAIGMNYDMVYDPNHELLVLVANLKGDPLAVWVLRL